MYTLRGIWRGAVQLFKRILSSIGLVVLSTDRHRDLLIKVRTLEAVVRLATYSSTKRYDSPCHIVVFSRDRAFQLHALLGSLYELTSKTPPVSVLYKTSSGEHARSYREALECYRTRQVTAIRESHATGFRQQLVEIAEGLRCERICFLVDDIVFVEPVVWSDLAELDVRTTIPSLRLGRNIRYSYAMRRSQSLPVFQKAEGRSPDLLYWRWCDGEIDWGYPLSLDGNLFARDEILVLLRRMDYRSPNSLESSLKSFSGCFQERLGVCYPKARTVNIPVNKVQDEVPNRYGTIHQDHLLDLWRGGYRMDWGAIRGYPNQSCHEEAPIRYVKRTG